MVLIVRPRPASNGTAIKAIRQAKGYRAGAFAHAIGISQPYLSNIEANRKYASPHVLSRIAEALEVPIGAITGPRPVRVEVETD